MALPGEDGNDNGGGDSNSMSVLVDRQTKDMGSVTRVEETYREEAGVLVNAYAKACAIVIDDADARKLVLAGSPAGWRYKLSEGDFVELWAPSTGQRPITYRFRNKMLWRAVKACNCEVIAQEA